MMISVGEQRKSGEQKKCNNYRLAAATCRHLYVVFESATGKRVGRVHFHNSQADVLETRHLATWLCRLFRADSGKKTCHRL